MDCRSNQAHSSSVFTSPSNELERTEESAAERGSKSIGADQRRAGGRGFERRGLPTRGDKSVALPYNSEPLEWSSQKEEDREIADGNEMNNMTDARAPKRKYNSEEEIGQSIVSAEAQLSKKLSHDARIVRVSRTSGGKDRHSKVLTTRGLRDRRVRLSVSTAIQFYDLQDRLGFDQPSKAVEWLIKAAADAIDDLPVLNTSEIQIHHRRHAAGAGAFSNAVPKENAHFLPYGSSVAINAAESSTNDSQSSKEGQCDEVLAVKSSSSTSEQDGSKGPDCSTLSRSESRVKARKRARERTMEKFSGSTSTSNIFSNYSFAGVLPPLGTLRNHYPHTDKYRPRGDLQVQCKRRNETQTSHWGNDIADDNEDEDHRHLLMAAAAMQPSASSAANSSGIAAILSHLNLQRNPEVTASGHGSSQQKHPVGNVTAAFAAGSNNNSNSFLLSSIDQDVLVQEHFAVNPAISNDMNLMISMPGISGRETLQSNSTSYVQPSPSHIQRMSSAEPSQFIFTNAGDAHYQGFHDAARMMHRIRDQFSFDEGSRDSPHDLKRNRSKHDQH